MPAIKDLNQISAKWKERSSTAGPTYQIGVENPRKDWATETANANSAYKAGIAKSVANDSFLKGVKRAGTSKWQEGAVKKGAGRWVEGINQAGTAYENGFSRYREVIARTQLPARGAKGDPKNIQRVVVMSKALHDEKIKSQA